MIKQFETQYIRMARNIASNLNDRIRCKHAAVLVERNKVISIGVNKSKSHPAQKLFRRNDTCSWIHAEVDCLKNVRNLDWKRTTLYVVRVNKHNELDESCPCEGCQRMINKYGVQRVVYSNMLGNMVEWNRNVA